MTNYEEFLSRKQARVQPAGFEVAPDALNPALFPFQAAIVRWALKVGRAALFEDCGLGKTLQQLEWARHVARHTDLPVLVLAPLAVAPQTRREGMRFGIPVTICQTQEDVTPGVNVTNYEKLAHFDPSAFGGVVLDESSILKAYTGKTKQALLAAFAETPYRLACTATPAPNDYLELGNHAEFLGVMKSNEMIMRWFINNSQQAGDYRLKRHAERDFWEWVSSWAVAIRTPSDLGDYSDAGFDLPPLDLQELVVTVDRTAESGEMLFRIPTMSATTMHQEMRLTAPARARAVAEMVNASEEAWAVWCNTNYEADELTRLIPDAIEVRGSESPAEKERKLNLFSEGRARVIITKPSIAGFGLNWQHCHNTAFVGLSYSFEQLYQALRRLYRFGQTAPVRAQLVIAETEGAILQTVKAKMKAHEELMESMTNSLGALQHKDALALTNTTIERIEGEDYELYLGDCVQVARQMDADSTDFSVFSPPFANLYIYSDDIADMGNCADYREFFIHYDFLASELWRITRPGRLCAIHCKDLPLYMNRDGAAGLYDFPGDLRLAMERAGWVYHSRVTIWKDPVTEMQRTKNHGLLHKNFAARREVVRQGMPDYLLVFRKWTEGMPDRQIDHPAVPGEYIGTNPPESWDSERDYSIQTWQRYASPVWFDINQMNVLNHRVATDDKDEKHICPLQLDVIERCIWLWSNPGDVVFSPFTGIGSEGYVALKMGRRFIGAELKASYFEWAARHLELALQERKQLDLFTTMGVEVA